MKKHNWKTDGDEYGQETNNPDKPYAFGAENMPSEYHNGPKCKDCGFEFCEHCNPEGFETECGAKSIPADEGKIVFRF